MQYYYNMHANVNDNLQFAICMLVWLMNSSHSPDFASHTIMEFCFAVISQKICKTVCCLRSWRYSKFWETCIMFVTWKYSNCWNMYSFQLSFYTKFLWLGTWDLQGICFELLEWAWGYECHVAFFHSTCTSTDTSLAFIRNVLLTLNVSLIENNC